MADHENFSDIMTRTREEVLEPRDPPVGVYRLTATSGKWIPEKDDVAPGYQIIFKATEAGEDIDLAELDAAGGLSTIRIFHRTFINDGRDEWNSWDLLDKLGVQTQGRTMPEAVPTVKGHEVYATVVLNPRKDGEGNYVNLKGFAPVE